jgi:hypothetical protein
VNRIVDVFSAVVVVAGIMVLVRPGSQGPALVRALGNAFTGSLTVATGSGVPRSFQVTPWR